MEISNEQKTLFIKRLLISRTRLLCSHPFFGLLLMHMKFALDDDLDTAATDGENIYFGVKFLSEISDSELDFVLMHEIMHVALKHCFRGKELNHEAFNIACDIVINSNILLENNNDLNSITIKKWGASMHIAPDGKEGYNYTAEQVYEMLIKRSSNKKSGSSSLAGSQSEKGDKGKQAGTSFDDHSRWRDAKEIDETLTDLWQKRVEDACKAIEVREATSGRGILPLFARRILKELKEPKIDWRAVLSNFVQEEVVDYSFLPPDRRFDGDFFLPDFSGTDVRVKKILFMIDTSGSMSDELVTSAYSEVKGAIDQFDGKLEGYLGFFDGAIIQPVPFFDEASLSEIKPVGGGGTNFQIIFDYVQKFMADDLPTSIIILTDGFAPFPPEKAALGIPVLWVICNEVVTPPWGKIARI